jgi:hypothetical protein
VRIIYPEYEKGKEELLKMVREELTKKKEKGELLLRSADGPEGRGP